MNELSSLRTENGKLFALDAKEKSGAPQYALEIRTGPVHYKETYKDTEPWLDLDETYCEPSEIKGIGKVLVYPKLPNIVTVYQDRCGYQIQSRSNPDHIARVELVGIDGQKVTAWQKTAPLNMYAKVHPYRVGIWKDFSGVARDKSMTMRWKITERGRSDKDTHPFFFRESPEAFNTTNLHDLSPAALNAAKISIETVRTRIDDSSWYWDEILPAAARLVDTDWQISAGANDGLWRWSGTTFNNTGSDLALGNWAYLYGAFMRFVNVGIGTGSTINAAYLTYKSSANNYLTVVNTNIHANDADNAVAPTSAAEAQALAVTSAVAWNGVGTWSAYATYTTPSIVTPVQTVINRAGWAYGNALQILHKNNGSTLDAYRQFYSYNGSTSGCPKITITWTAPGCLRPRVFVPNVSWLSKSLLKRREV